MSDYLVEVIDPFEKEVLVSFIVFKVNSQKEALQRAKDEVALHYKNSEIPRFISVDKIPKTGVVGMKRGDILYRTI